MSPDTQGPKIRIILCPKCIRDRPSNMEIRQYNSVEILLIQSLGTLVVVCRRCHKAVIKFKVEGSFVDDEIVDVDTPLGQVELDEFFKQQKGAKHDNKD